MKRYFVQYALLLVISLAASMGLAIPSAAATTSMASPARIVGVDLFNGVQCNQGRNSESAVCTDNHGNDTITGKNGLLSKIADIITYVAGAAAVIVIIVSGIQYITSNGDSNKASTARSSLIYAVVGLIIIVMARTIITFVIGKL